MHVRKGRSGKERWPFCSSHKKPSWNKWNGFFFLLPVRVSRTSLALAQQGSRSCFSPWPLARTPCCNSISSSSMLLSAPAPAEACLAAYLLSRVPLESDEFVILWMDGILHHLKIPRNYSLQLPTSVVVWTMVSFRGAKWILPPSAVSRLGAPHTPLCNNRAVQRKYSSFPTFSRVSLFRSAREASKQTTVLGIPPYFDAC